MLMRLVKPMRRQGSRFAYHACRVPRDVQQAAVGLKLHVPLGNGETHILTITPRMARTQVRFSLRVPVDTEEAKQAQAAVAAHMSRVWQALRESGKAATLTHKQAVALAGELYRAWAGGEGRERTLAVEQNPATGRMEPADAPMPQEEAALWEAVNEGWRPSAT